MKRPITFVLAAVMLLCLAACGKEEVKQMDMAKVYEKITQQVTMPQMLELDADLMLDYCGIYAEDVKQAVVVICSDGITADEIWLLEAKDADSAKRLMETAQKRLDKKAEEQKNYSAEQYAVVQKGILEQHGNYIALLVSPDVETMAKIFRQEAGV